MNDDSRLGVVLTQRGPVIIAVPVVSTWIVVARALEDTLRRLGFPAFLPDDALADLARRLAAECATTVYGALFSPDRPNPASPHARSEGG